MKRARISLALALTVLSALTYACGNTRNGTADVDAATDAGPDALADAPLDLAVAPIPLACPPRTPAPPRTYAPPAPLHQGACDHDDAYSLLRCFVSNPQGRDCVGEHPRDVRVDSGCGRCMFTDVDASEYGPIIVDGRSARLNVGGCLERVTSSIDAGCAGEFNALEECAISACQHCYDEDASQSDSEACLVAARSGPCSALAIGPVCARAALGDAAPACQLTGDFVARATVLVDLFCGASPDAGSVDGSASD